MNSKTAIAIIGILFAILLAGGIWYFFFHSASTPINNGSSSGNPFGAPAGNVGPGNTSGTPVGGGTATTSSLTIQDTSGASVTVPDFTASHTPIEEGSQTYYDLSHSGPVYGDEKDQFDILYGENNSYFLITLLAEPLGDTRLSAQAALASMLNLSDSELCKLNITVGVPYSVNSVYSTYSNLGLSFCSGSTELPQ
jgi:hypothetical protein